jgi:hypothetical protein
MGIELAEGEVEAFSAFVRLLCSKPTDAHRISNAAIESFEESVLLASYGAAGGQEDLQGGL